MNLSKKQEYLIIAGLLVLIFPFFALLFYVHPQGDDFFFAARVNELGVLGFVKDMYLHWSGRYASMFIGAFGPIRIGSIIYLRVILLLFHLFHIFSFYLLFKSLVKPGFSSKKLFLFTLAIYTISINTIPDIFEHLYWFPSVTAYLLGSSLLFIISALILFRNKYRINLLAYTITASVLGVILVGLLEIFALPTLLIIFVNGFYLVKNKIKIIPEIIIFSVIFIATLIVIIAPGNYVRMHVGGGFYDTVLGTYLAVKSVFYLFGYIFQDASFVLGSILLLGFFNELINSNNNPIAYKLNKFHPIILLLIVALGPFLIFIPSTVALRALPAGRIFDLAATIFYPLWIFALYHFAYYYKNKVKLTLPNFYKKIFIGLVVLFMFSGFYVTNMYEFARKKEGSLLIHGNILNAYHTLFYKACGFDRDMQHKKKIFEEAKELKLKTIKVHPFEYNPRNLLLVDWNEKQYLNKWIVSWEIKYYGLDSIYIEPRKTKDK